MNQGTDHFIERASEDSADGANSAALADVNVSIVTYRSDTQELGGLLRSLRSSKRVHHIAVTDNSPDERLRACVESCGAEYLTLGRNIGFGAGHNYALRHFKNTSKYHLVVNPDIACGQETIEALYSFLEKRPNIGLVMPRVVYPDGSEQHLCKQIPSPLDLFTRRFTGRLGRFLFTKRLNRYELRNVDLRVAREIPCLSGCFMFIRSSALRNVGLFDERYFMYMEDVDLCRRIGRYYKVVFYPHVSITHVYAKGSYRSVLLLKYHTQSAIRYFSKWGWFSDSERRAFNEKTNAISLNSNNQ